MIEIEIPISITFESEDVNKLFELYVEKCHELLIDFEILSMFKKILELRGKVELRNKYIFRLKKES